MNRHVTTAVAVLALAACGGARSASEPVYELRATETPLRYDLDASQLTVIELPTGGEQEVENSTSAVLSLAFGEAAAEGLPFVLTFEELEMGGVTAGVDLSAIIGEPIRGTVSSAGGITVDEAPEVDVPGFDPGGLAELISPLIVPLPPEGDASAESWPLERSREVGGPMSGRSSFEGTVRFTPETQWEGQEVRILVSEGELRQRASGSPPGAPGEVDVDLEGQATTTYVWDPTRGVALQVEQQADMEGTVAMQGMALPMTTTATQTFVLLP